MAIVNTFDPQDGADLTEQEAAERRALEVGSKLVESQEEAAQERFRKASEIDENDARFAGKYRSAEELEKAYLELQKKLGEKGNNQEPEEAAQDAEEPQEEASDEGEDEEVDEELTDALRALTEASSEFENGGLSKETIDKLAELDSRTLVETWAEYVKSQREQAVQGAVTKEQADYITQSVGGQQAYSEMLGWAADNLTPDEIATYDAVMNGGDAGAMYWAAQGLKARYSSEAGYEGQRYTGSRAPAPEPGFRSQAELARAIADPRYKDDPAYRIDVQEKLARSGSLL